MVRNKAFPIVERPTSENIAICRSVRHVMLPPIRSSTRPDILLRTLTVIFRHPITILDFGRPSLHPTSPIIVASPPSAWHPMTRSRDRAGGFGDGQQARLAAEPRPISVSLYRPRGTARIGEPQRRELRRGDTLLAG